ncbi:MAG: hypothetical protein KGL04_04555 [Elusimicrobia bacterium]|nr:hypothetical protein [Elusimicrobiota bacterium]
MKKITLAAWTALWLTAALCGLATAKTGVSTGHPTRRSAPTPKARVIDLPGGQGGLHMDDLFYDAALGRVVVPAGAMGSLDFVGAAAGRVDSIGGFAAQKPAGRRRGGGISSAAAGDGLIFTTDRANQKLYAVDFAHRTVVATAALAHGPDYVRYLPSSREIWVTEPRAHGIQTFSLPMIPGAPPVINPSGFIKIPGGGPEALVIDAARGRAYTNLHQGVTLAIDLKTRKIAARWKNGCRRAEGLALDEARGFLFVACAEGKADVLNLKKEGKIVSSLAAGNGIDIIAYAPKLARLYLPGARSATLTAAKVSPSGRLSRLWIAKTAPGAHCVTADERGNAWVCDPRAGALLHFYAPAR